jgi:hypothetical protein
MLADSLDVLMPGQRVRLVRAIHKAFADSKPDTVRFRVEKADSIDWLQGDTIVAHFDTSATKDSSKTPDIKQLVATVNARALYHMAPSDSAEHRPAINHVIAREIIVAFDGKKVASVTTVDSVFGVFIEPRSDSSATRRASGGTPTNTPPKQRPASIVPLPPKPPRTS